MSNNIKVIFFITFFFSLTPYIKTSPFSSDTQPHYFIALTLSILLISITKKKIPISYKTLFAAFFFATSSILLSATPNDTASIFFLIITVGLIINYSKKSKAELLLLLGKVATTATVFYIVFTIIEATTNHNILEWMISNPRPSTNRGFISATSEPSFLGLISLSLIILLEVTKAKYYRILQTINIVNLLASFAASIIAPFIIIVFLYTIHKRSYRVIISLAFFLVLLAFLLPYIEMPERISKLLINSNDLDYILADQSFANRISRSTLPIIEAFSSYLTPHQMDYIDVSSMSNSILEQFIFIDYEVPRLSSSLGVFLYGFGFLSLPLLFFYVYTLYKKKIPLYIIFSIAFFSTANVSIAAPYVMLILSIPWLMLPSFQNTTVRDS